MNATSESRLAELHPTLAAKIHQLAEMLAEEGMVIDVLQGLRSWTEQASLWARGRDANGNVIDAPLVVTDAPPGHSWHQFGLACDCIPIFVNPTSQADAPLDWNSDHPQWKRMQAVGQSLGLVSGATFKRLVDAPHFQLTGKFPESPTDEVRQLFKDGGTLAVWEAAGIGET